MRKALTDEFKRQRGRFEETVELVTVYLRHLLRFRELVPIEEIPVRVSARVKSESSITRKLSRIKRRERIKVDSVRQLMQLMDDIAGVRIICDYLDDVAVTYQYLVKHNAFRVLQGKTQDYIARPRDGYRAIHTVVEVRTSFGKTKCEVQIQTALQHAWASKNHVLLYKLEKERLRLVPRETQRLMEQQSDMLYTIDQQAIQVRQAVERYLRRHDG